MNASYQSYDLASAFEAGIEAARRAGEARYVIQDALGYNVEKTLRLPLKYNGWKVNADGSIADFVHDKGHQSEPLEGGMQWTVAACA